MSEAAHDKQHDATQHRLQQAGRDGRFVRSRQLSSLIFCCGAGVVLWATGDGLLDQISESARVCLGRVPNISGGEVARFQSTELWKLAGALAPTLGLFGCVAWLAHAWQSGFKIFPHKLSLDWDRVNPARGVARLFSIRNLNGAIGGMSRLICILAVGMLLIWIMRERLAMLSFVPHGMTGNAAFEIGIQVLGGIAALMFVFAGIDWLYQSKLHQDGLRLSNQEYRDEMKSIEGDPQIKMRQNANRTELMQARNDLVATRAADLIVYSRIGEVAAIRYDQTTSTPLLVATASGFAGQRIIEAARTKGVKTVSNDRLAASIIATNEVGRSIPAKLWHSLQQA